MTDEEVRDYLRNLKIGERVIETGNSCMTGRKGDVVLSTMPKGGTSVKWDSSPGETGRMTTSATWGTRRIADVKQDNPSPPTPEQ